MTNWNSSTQRSAASGLPLCIIGRPLAIVIGRLSHLAIGTITSLPVDLVTFNFSFIGNHPHRHLTLWTSYCHLILPSWTRAQKRCQHIHICFLVRTKLQKYIDVWLLPVDICFYHLPYFIFFVCVCLSNAPVVYAIAFCVASVEMILVLHALYGTINYLFCFFKSVVV